MKLCFPTKGSPGIAPVLRLLEIAFEIAIFSGIQHRYLF
jgi:hypothetical protein